MKRAFGILLMVVIGMLVFGPIVTKAQQGPGVRQGFDGIYYNCFGLKDAAGEIVGDTVWHLSSVTDYDSSITFNAITWDRLYVQAKFIGGADLTGTTVAASRDSSNVRVYAAGSINGTNWKLLDSLSVIDTLVNFKNYTWIKYPWIKIIVAGLAKIDSAGAAGQVRMCYDGDK